MSQLSPRRDLLCFSHLRWDFVTQRPQHLMTRAARDRKVSYVEEPIFHAAAELPRGAYLELRSVQHNLCVVRPHLVHGCDADAAQADLIMAFLADRNLHEYDAWFYTPMACGFTRLLRPQVLVYDCMDELKNFLHAPPQLRAYEEELLCRADVVFTGGRSLFESKRSSHSQVFAFPSSIEPEHFAAALSPDIQEPADQACLPQPRAGFYGVLDERLDLDLLRDIAKLRPDVQFVILGPVAKIDPASLPQASNIHYLGGKSYDELPAYLSGWDVALLPFAINEATRYISPTKTPEYLAGGRRVVSTPIHDVVAEYGDAGLVEIAGTAAAFAAAIDRALLPTSAAWTADVERALARTSWDSTWECMQAAMDAAVPASTHCGRPSSADQRALRGATRFSPAPRSSVPESLSYSPR